MDPGIEATAARVAMGSHPDKRRAERIDDAPPQAGREGGLNAAMLRVDSGPRLWASTLGLDSGPLQENRLKMRRP